MITPPTLSKSIVKRNPKIYMLYYSSKNMCASLDERGRSGAIKELSAKQADRLARWIEPRLSNLGDLVLSPDGWACFLQASEFWTEISAWIETMLYPNGWEAM